MGAHQRVRAAARLRTGEQQPPPFTPVPTPPRRSVTSKADAAHLLEALLEPPRAKAVLPLQLGGHSFGAEAGDLRAAVAVENAENVALVTDVLRYVGVLLQNKGKGSG